MSNEKWTFDNNLGYFNKIDRGVTNFTPLDLKKKYYLKLFEQFSHKDTIMYLQFQLDNKLYNDSKGQTVAFGQRMGTNVWYIPRLPVDYETNTTDPVSIRFRNVISKWANRDDYFDYGLKDVDIINAFDTYPFVWFNSEFWLGYLDVHRFDMNYKYKDSLKTGLLLRPTILPNIRSKIQSIDHYVVLDSYLLERPLKPDYGTYYNGPKFVPNEIDKALGYIYYDEQHNKITYVEHNENFIKASRTNDGIECHLAPGSNTDRVKYKVTGESSPYVDTITNNIDQEALEYIYGKRDSCYLKGWLPYIKLYALCTTNTREKVLLYFDLVAEEEIAVRTHNKIMPLKYRDNTSVVEVFKGPANMDFNRMLEEEEVQRHIQESMLHVYTPRSLNVDDEDISGYDMVVGFGDGNIQINRFLCDNMNIPIPPVNDPKFIPLVETNKRVHHNGTLHYNHYTVIFKGLRQSTPAVSYDLVDDSTEYTNLRIMTVKDVMPIYTSSYHFPGHSGEYKKEDRYIFRNGFDPLIQIIDPAKAKAPLNDYLVMHNNFHTNIDGVEVYNDADLNDLRIDNFSIPDDIISSFIIYKELPNKEKVNAIYIKAVLDKDLSNRTNGKLLGYRYVEKVAIPDGGIEDFLRLKDLPEIDLSNFVNNSLNIYTHRKYVQAYNDFTNSNLSSDYLNKQFHSLITFKPSYGPIDSYLNTYLGSEYTDKSIYLLNTNLHEYLGISKDKILEAFNYITKTGNTLTTSTNTNTYISNNKTILTYNSNVTGSIRPAVFNVYDGLENTYYIKLYVRFSGPNVKDRYIYYYLELNGAKTVDSFAYILPFDIKYATEMTTEIIDNSLTNIVNQPVLGDITKPYSHNDNFYFRRDIEVRDTEYHAEYPTQDTLDRNGYFFMIEGSVASSAIHGINRSYTPNSGLTNTIFVHNIFKDPIFRANIDLLYWKDRVDDKQQHFASLGLDHTRLSDLLNNITQDNYGQTISIIDYNTGQLVTNPNPENDASYLPRSGFIQHLGHVVSFKAYGVTPLDYITVNETNYNGNSFNPNDIVARWVYYKDPSKVLVYKIRINRDNYTVIKDPNDISMTGKIYFANKNTSDIIVINSGITEILEKIKQNNLSDPIVVEFLTALDLDLGDSRLISLARNKAMYVLFDKYKDLFLKEIKYSETERYADSNDGVWVFNGTYTSPEGLSIALNSNRPNLTTPDGVISQPIIITTEGGTSEIGLTLDLPTNAISYT